MSALPELAMAGDRPDHISWLQSRLASNRFLPMPPAELHNIGDGDYRAIGAEFLGHFVRIGGLLPTERVLDIGCGLGRMAVPLTQYLDDAPGYDGVDIVRSGIEWCDAAITRHYPNFRFHHLDFVHPLYNPEGHVPSGAWRLPFADGSFDFILLTSVMTHLLPDEAAAYGREIRRLLRPRGRAFITLFLAHDEARRLVAAEKEARLPFRFDDGHEGVYFADPQHPTAAVAYDEALFVGLMKEAGLRLLRAPLHGGWCGCRHAGHYQDFCLFGAD